MSLLVNIVLFIIIGIVLFLSLRNQKRKEDKYLGKKVPFTKKELKILARYQAEYTKIDFDPRLPTMKKDKYELEDIAKSATQMVFDQPIPTQEEKRQIEEGQYVQLKFLDSDYDVERMWVEVLEKDGDLFKSILRNDSFSSDQLVADQEIWFHANHIFRIGK